MEKLHILSMAAKLAPVQDVDQRGRPRPVALDPRPQPQRLLDGHPRGQGPRSLLSPRVGPLRAPRPRLPRRRPQLQQPRLPRPRRPAKAILWDNPKPLRSGLPAHSLWHWRQSDFWDSGFVPDGEYGDGWWAVTECDILYSANFVLAGCVSEALGSRLRRSRRAHARWARRRTRRIRRAQRPPGRARQPQPPQGGCQMSRRPTPAFAHAPDRSGGGPRRAPPARARGATGTTRSAATSAASPGTGRR
jgi:hypothetical protein